MNKWLFHFKSPLPLTVGWRWRNPRFPRPQWWSRTPWAAAVHHEARWTSDWWSRSWWTAGSRTGGGSHLENGTAECGMRRRLEEWGIWCRCWWRTWYLRTVEVGKVKIIMMYFKTKILLSQKHNQHLPWKCRTRPMLTTHTCLGNVVRYPCWLGMVKREASHAMRDFFCLSKREATSLTRVSRLVSHLTRRLAAIWAIPHSHCRLTMFSECGGVEQVQFLRKYQETLYVQHFLRSKACNIVWWWNG